MSSDDTDPDPTDPDDLNPDDTDSDDLNPDDTDSEPTDPDDTDPLCDSNHTNRPSVKDLTDQHL